MDAEGIGGPQSPADPVAAPRQEEVSEPVEAGAVAGLAAAAHSALVGSDPPITLSPNEGRKEVP